MLLSCQASLVSVFHSLLWKKQDYHSEISITRNKFDQKKSCIGLLKYVTGNDDQYWEQFPRERLSCKSQWLPSSKTAILKLSLSPSNSVATSHSTQKAANRQIVEVSSHSPGRDLSSPALQDHPSAVPVPKPGQ